MYLMYHTTEDGNRTYTLKAGLELWKVDPAGSPTLSAHPARFSPDDKFSRERVTTKRRFNLLPTQHPAPTF